MPIRAGRTKPRRGYKTAKQRIEETPRIATREMAWYKEKGKSGQMRPAAEKRTGETVRTSAPTQIDRSQIHTHRSKKFGNIAIPTPLDFFGFFRDVQHSSVKTYHIARLDEKGKVIGYYSFRGTKKLVALSEADKKDLIDDANWIMAQATMSGEMGIARILEFIESLKRRGLIMEKKIPMAGYQYKEGRFIPKTS